MRFYSTYILSVNRVRIGEKMCFYLEKERSTFTHVILYSHILNNQELNNSVVVNVGLIHKFDLVWPNRSHSLKHFQTLALHTDLFRVLSPTTVREDPLQF